ncbi:ribonuclease P protein component [Salinibacterium sp. SYSU T00001]|uniref:ribonuclease P protein component n=1 Tax=Homoserinimonas sedimenticola TaxID=2986805 RepID=UPI00223595D9|nr:ribonuclease P protein component [Salinibacterium sedimenticola]MCW4385806.1 ribonuclease P protein component [Salinibacterium sedimenticola]
MLARAERLVSAADYRRVVRRGRRASGDLMTVYAVDSATDAQHPWRFGFIVSKAVGNAVTRNRVRRRLKAISYRVLHGELSPMDDRDSALDIVFRAHAPAAAADFSVLQDQAVSLIARASTRVRSQEPRS